MSAPTTDTPETVAGAAHRLADAIARYAVSEQGLLDDPQVLDLARRTLIDTVGVAVAGRDEPAVRIATAQFPSAPGRSTIWADGRITDAPTAALLNGVAGHALDFDDVTDVVMGHPSVVLWPAVFAAAEEVGAGGRALLEAYVAGFVAHVAVARSMDIPRHYATGWHSTATVGIIGAAAGVARLHGLDVDATRTAIGIASSMAGGSRQNFGTMTKPLHPGLAARDAVLAVRLAKAGFTADLDELDKPLGYFSRFADGSDVEAGVAALRGAHAFLESGINVKKYPCCYNTHRLADATLDVRAEAGIDPASVTEVHVVLEPLGFEPLIHHGPQTGLQGKFSAEYVIAAALLDGEVTLQSFTDEAVQRPGAQNLLEKVTYDVSGTPPHGSAEWDHAYAVLRVTTTSGEHVFRTDVPRGDHRAPLTTEDVAAKFTACVAFGRQGWDAVQLRQQLWDLVDSDTVATPAAMAPAREA